SVVLSSSNPTLSSVISPLSLHDALPICSITPHTDFEAQVYVLSKDEGGRHTPFFSNYRPQFYFRTTDVTGGIKLPEGQEMVMPRSEEHTSELQSRFDLVCRLLLEKNKKI